MPFFSRKETVKNPPVLEVFSENLTNNSKIISSSVSNSKKLIVPVSKVLDYVFVSGIAVLLYRYYLFNM